MERFYSDVVLKIVLLVSYSINLSPLETNAKCVVAVLKYFEIIETIHALCFHSGVQMFD